MSQDQRAGSPGALLEAANRKRLAGEYLEAIDLQLAAIQLKPDAVNYVNLGVMQLGLLRYDDAVQSLLQALLYNPDLKEALYNLGIALRMQGDHLAAIHCNLRVVELDPTYIDAYDNLCTSYIALKNFDAVAKHAMQAIAFKPDHANAYFHLGISCYEQGNLSGGVTFLERGVALAPNDHNIRSALSLVRLAMGDLSAGWQEYEARWMKKTRPVAKPNYPYRWWSGESGLTVLIWGEQGVGDQIMFASMINDAIARTRQVILACSKKLIPLFRRSFPKAQIIDLANVAELSEFRGSIDVQTALGSAARWLRPTIESFSKQPYFLIPDQERVRFWKSRLAELGPALNVGICWRSGDMSGDRMSYCTQIAQWEPIFSVPGVRFVNLQYDECMAELSLARERFGITVHAFPEVDLFDDLDETAALTKALDLVISTPTTAGILAAALGVPTWQMVSGFSWQKFGTAENCWYTSLTTVQRTWDQPWEKIIGEVAVRLKKQVAQQQAQQSEPSSEMTIDMALLYHQQGRLGEAKQAYEQLLRAQPDHAQALHFSGVLAYQSREYDDAERYISRSIQIDSSQPHYYCNYGMVLRDHGNYAQSVDMLNKAIALKPDYDEAYLNLSAALFNLDKFAESAEAARAAIALNPHNAKAYDNLGTAQRSLNDFAGSIQSYERAIQLDPHYVAAYSNLAATYFELKDLDAMIAHCNQAIRLDHNHANAYLYLGIAYQHMNDFAQAEKFMRHAAQLTPDNFLTKWNLGLLLLAMGRLEQGWQGYESRWYLETAPMHIQPFDYPWWQGEAMPYKTILIWWEQGVGDQIMFASMFDDLITRFARCIIACPKKLVPLFARSFPAAHIVSQNDSQQLALLRNTINVQSAIGSLARWLRPDIASFPKKHHYLTADPGRVTYWKQRLAELGPALNVGICWRSGNTTGGRLFYGSRVEQWGPIFSVPGVRFVNLQYDECRVELGQIQTLFGTQVLAFPEVDLFDDLDETAALTAALDLVIAIPTTSAILAAALGTPAWMLLSGYTWQHFGTEENRWYATARSFRREWNQPWEAMMPIVAEQLKLLVQKASDLKNN